MKNIIKELLKSFFCPIGCYFTLNIIAFHAGKKADLLGSLLMLMLSIVLSWWILREEQR